jgi:hypothetical protein
MAKHSKAMKVLEVYNDKGVMVTKLRVDKKRLRWFYWEGIPLALIVFCLLSVR